MSGLFIATPTASYGLGQTVASPTMMEKDLSTLPQKMDWRITEFCLFMVTRMELYGSGAAVGRTAVVSLGTIEALSTSPSQTDWYITQSRLAIPTRMA